MKLSAESFIGFVVLLLLSMFSFKMLEARRESISYKTSSMNSFYADIYNVDGIKVGSRVKILGVEVGRVSSIKFRPNEMLIKIEVSIQNDLRIPKDSILAVSTDGIFGQRFVSIIPGFDESFLQNGDKIQFTRSAVNLEDLIAKFATK